MPIGDAITLKSEMKDALDGSDESLRDYLIAEGVLRDAATPEPRPVEDEASEND